jgi:hypothetical protein
VSSKLRCKGRGTRRLLLFSFAEGRCERERASQRLAYRRRLVIYESTPPDGTKTATDHPLLHPSAFAEPVTHRLRGLRVLRGSTAFAHRVFSAGCDKSPHPTPPPEYEGRRKETAFSQLNL